jgi:hypothetical protein
MANLFQIVYVSCSVGKLTEMDLDNLLEEIREKNIRKGVTGLLLYNDELFIQIIEGERTVIEELYAVLAKDARHNNIVKILEEPVECRSFPNWSMGYKKLNKNESMNLPGFNELMHNNNPEQVLRGNTQQILYLVESFMQHT